MNDFVVELSGQPSVYSEQMQGGAVSEIFICPYPNLCGVGVQVSNDGRTNSCFVSVKILRHTDKSRIAEKNFDMSRNPQGSLNLNFKPLVNSEGQSYEVIITETESGLSNSVLLLMVPPGSYEGVFTCANSRHKRKFEVGHHLFLRLYFGESARFIVGKAVKEKKEKKEEEASPGPSGRLEKRVLKVPTHGNLKVRLSHSSGKIFVVESDEKGGTIKEVKKKT